MTLTCATCLHPFAGRLARHTDEGYVHVTCPRAPEYLPFAPFAGFMPWVQQWPRNDRLRQAVEKARTRGTITIRTADRAAIRLGTHPALIWGDAWWVPGEVAA